MMRTVDQIQSDISWKFQRVNDSQEHAYIVKLEEDIAKLQHELKAVQNATQLPTPDETMVDIFSKVHPHVNAAFINALREEGTKKELAEYLQNEFNTSCAYDKEIRRLQSELAAANARAEGEYARGIERVAQFLEGSYKMGTLMPKEGVTPNSIRALLPNSKKEPHEAT
jgi:hypothetical protein